MPRIEEKNNPILPIFYVIDTSGSMVGARIAAVNQAMVESQNVLKEVATENAVDIQIGVLQFASGCGWVNKDKKPSLTSAEDFFWNPISAGGITDLGSVLDEMYESFSRHVLFNSYDAGIPYKMPVIIFMSDGEPTDNWEKALEKVEKNNWYKWATKIAIAIDDESDVDVLAKVVGKREAVIKVTDMEALKKLIRILSATASKIGSKSKTGADIDPTDEIIKEIKDKTKDDKDITIEKDPNPNPPKNNGSDGWPDPDDPNW
jgi:uncharacterized protein YegL